MSDPDKIKLLDNYQLYQLIQSNSIDRGTLSTLRKEFNSRSLSNSEKSRIENKYQLNYFNHDSEIEKHNWNPLFTAFALNLHFRHLAALKNKKKKKEAKKYMIELYIGLALYFAIIILIAMILIAE